MPTPLIEARTRIAAELAAHIALCVARRDSRHAAFRGCLDWHSAVHGVWALVAYARMTGDRRHDRLVARILEPARPRGGAGPAAGARRLRDALRPGLVSAAGAGARDRLLQPCAAADGRRGAGLAARLLRHPAAGPPPRKLREQLLGPHQYARLRRAGRAMPPRWRRYVAGCARTPRRDEGGCDDAPETGHFMAVGTNRAWLVSKVLVPEAFDPWAETFFARRPAAAGRRVP